ncbi:MAG: xanthine dehydrogenase family protein molybdopterin-binding subunit, partial [Actinobacteria bacterium]|nr:xanthine dehydrogenase family protein molybdopterin-binding subunit [Actinomycetota bacterium]
MTTTADPMSPAEFGRARKRKEDARLITGRARWTDNISLPGMVHLAVLRSPVAHATIGSIDVQQARRQPGVFAVYTGRDFADEQGSLPCAWPISEDMVAPQVPALAVQRVNFVGEAVAVVAARSAAQAHDAVASIQVDYQGLPAVLD